MRCNLENAAAISAADTAVVSKLRQQTRPSLYMFAIYQVQELHSSTLYIGENLINPTFFCMQNLKYAEKELIVITAKCLS